MKVKEIGNLTTDPNYGEKGDMKYCNFCIAINSQIKKEETEFVQVSAYGRQAESCRDYLQKRSQVCVEGNIKANAYIDKDGNAQASLNINANEVQFLNHTKDRDGKSNIDNAMKQTEQNQGNSSRYSENTPTR